MSLSTPVWLRYLYLCVPVCICLCQSKFVYLYLSGLSKTFYICLPPVQASLICMACLTMENVMKQFYKNPDMDVHLDLDPE